MSLKKVAPSLGIIGALCYVAHDLAGFFYPGYSHLKQAVSDLTAVGSPILAVTKSLSIAYGIFATVCCIYAVLVIRRMNVKSLCTGSVVWLLMNIVSAVGYYFYPLGSGNDTMHIIITVVVVICSIVSLVLFMIGGYRNKEYRNIGVAASIAMIAMMSGAILTNVVPMTVVGVVERFSTYGAVLFTAYLGIWTGKQMLRT